jgi:hypothetical protein
MNNLDYFDKFKILTCTDLLNQQTHEMRRYLKHSGSKPFDTSCSKTLRFDLKTKDYLLTEKLDQEIVFKRRDEVCIKEGKKKKLNQMSLYLFESTLSCVLANTNITEKIILNTLEYFDYDGFSECLRCLCITKPIQTIDLIKYGELADVQFTRPKRVIKEFEIPRQLVADGDSLILTKYDQIQLLAFNINFNSLYKICNKQLERLILPARVNKENGFNINSISINERTGFDIDLRGCYLPISNELNFKKTKLLDNINNDTIELKFTDSNLCIYIEDVKSLFNNMSISTKPPTRSSIFYKDLNRRLTENLVFTDLPVIRFDKTKVSNTERPSKRKRKHCDLDPLPNDPISVPFSKSKKKPKLLDSSQYQGFILINSKTKQRLDFEYLLLQLTKLTFNHYIIDDNMIPELDLVIDMYSCVIIVNPNLFTDEYDNSGYDSLYSTINKYILKYNKFYLYYSRDYNIKKFTQNLENFITARFNGVDIVITNKLEDVLKSKQNLFDAMIYPLFKYTYELAPIILRFQKYPLINIIEAIVFLIVNEKKHLAYLKTHIIEVSIHLELYRNMRKDQSRSTKRRYLK